MAGIGAYDPVLFVEPRWLCCPHMQLQVGPREWDGLWFVVHPDSGIGDLWSSDSLHVRETGHFNDPAAQRCQYTEDYSGVVALPEDAVTGCRRTFVVTDHEVLDG